MLLDFWCWTCGLNLWVWSYDVGLMIVGLWNAGILLALWCWTWGLELMNSDLWFGTYALGLTDLDLFVGLVMLDFKFGTSAFGLKIWGEWFRTCGSGLIIWDFWIRIYDVEDFAQLDPWNPESEINHVVPFLGFPKLIAFWFPILRILKDSGIRNRKSIICFENSENKQRNIENSLVSYSWFQGFRERGLLNSEIRNRSFLFCFLLEKHENQVVSDFRF